MLFHSPKMNVQLMKMLQKRPKRCPFGHLGKGVHVLGKALAAIAELAIRSGNVGVHVIDIAGEKDAGMHLAPVGSHLFTVFTAGVEVCDLIGTEHIVHVLGELGL